LYDQHLVISANMKKRQQILSNTLNQHKNLITNIQNILFDDNDDDDDNHKSKWIVTKLVVVSKICDIICNDAHDEYDICEKVIMSIQEFVDKFLHSVILESYITDFKHQIAFLLSQRKVFSTTTKEKIATKAIFTFGDKISVQTALATYNSYKKELLNSDTFRDKRGTWARPEFLVDIGLYVPFHNFLKFSRTFSIDTCRNWLLGLISEKFEDTHYARKVKLARSTIHKWLLAMGCKYSKSHKTYYTDRHDTDENVDDRINRYIPDQFNLSVRQPVWVTVETKSIDEKILDIALADANARTSSWTADQQTVDQEKVRIHVDFLAPDVHSKYRETLLKTTGHPGEFFWDNITTWPNLGCKYGHSRDVCKCQCPIIKIGHDEKIYHAHSQPGKGWSYQGTQKLSKKGVGAGIMVSGIVDSYNGYGLEMSEQALSDVNFTRSQSGKSKLIDSPGSVFFEYGENREGYWDNEHMAVQLDDIMDCMEYLHPDCQLAFELDRSSGHMKFDENALVASHLNVNFGGKQPIMRDSIISRDVKLGEGSKLHHGDVQRMYFTDDDDPPFYQPAAPKYNETVRVFNKKTNEWVSKEIEGYVNKPKGIKQILHERGLYHKEMVGHSTYLKKLADFAEQGQSLPNQSHIDMEFVLSQQHDFMNEKPNIQNMIEARGHIFLPSVKCHPEMAGNGIEYIWGCSERIFRKNNDQSIENFKRTIKMSLSSQSLPMERIWKFERRSRDYMRNYRTIGHNETSYVELENMRKICKSHRNISEIEAKYLNNELNSS
jgi:hypothetical protein